MRFFVKSGAILATLMSTQQVSANLIGLDFGSSFIKATLVRPGKKFEIVENTASMRKTENQVTIGKESRLYGADSFLEAGKYPLATFTEFQRVFGQKFDADALGKYKKERFVTNEFAADDRGQVAWKVTRPAHNEHESQDEVLYSEEVVAMMMQYIRMLAEKQAGERVDEVVITVPHWFSYDQRLMVRDAAEQFAGLNVLQLVHENTAATVLFGIDKVSKEAQNHTVLFYNMGGMDTEVTISRYSHLNFTEEQKRATPYMEVLSEASVRDLGSRDIDLVLTNLLADKFNALPERAGKPDVRENVRALKRLQKEVIKIKEVLSANKQASIKVPELLDYVTLQLVLGREELEQACTSVFDRIMGPVEEALKKAGMTMEQIDQVELLGGGIRMPKITQILETAMPGKELGVHLNGDEAMCFGSAFLGSNSTTSFKVGKVLLTQNIDYDIKAVISPLNASESIPSEEDQKSEGKEEADLVQYSKTLRLFNSSDYLGKSKALTMNYDVDMKVELFKIAKDADIESAESELLDTFELTDLKVMFSYEVEKRQKDVEREKEKKKKRAEKLKAAAKNETEGEEKKEEVADKADEAEEEQKPVERPKLRLSIELSRSGYFRVVTSRIGGTDVDAVQVKKTSQLSQEGMKAARERLRWYKKRDEDKERNDIARNEYESLVYKMREWLREEDNEAYVLETEREDRITYLNELEDWLYDDGSDANYTVLEKRRKDLDKDFSVYTSRKQMHETLPDTLSKAKSGIEKLVLKTNKLETEKPHITEEERNDVLARAKELTEWLAKEALKSDGKSKNEDLSFDSSELSKKLKKLTQLYKKVSSKKAPKPKKEKKKKEDEEKKTEEGSSEEKSEGSSEEKVDEEKKDL